MLWFVRMNPKSPPRRTWIAVLLQLITPGMGNMYCGRFLRGVLIYAANWLIWTGCLVSVLWTPPLINIAIPLIGLVSLYVFNILDVVRFARQNTPTYQNVRYYRWYSYVGAYALAYVFSTFVVAPSVAIVFGAFRNTTASMEPTLCAGERFIVNKTAYLLSDPHRGEVVLFSRPGEKVQFVKRVIGLPGELIEIRGKAVFINGRTIEEPYVLLPKNRASPGEFTTPTVVPTDSYYLLGDNRDNSQDSRFFGPIRRADIHGRVRAVYFSRDVTSGAMRWGRFGQIPQ